MSTRRTARRSARPSVVGGVLASLCLVATACGSAGNGDDAIDDAFDDTSDAPLSVTDHDLEAGSSGGLRYGQSLDEWRATNDPARNQRSAQPGFELIDWDQLVPPDFSADAVLAQFDEAILAVERGSPEADALYEEMKAVYDDASIERRLDGRAIQLAGFVAPLTYDGDRITEFLLVPYFGACIHVPPPPVNQTVLISLADGQSMSLDESFGAVWVTGEMTATATETTLASAGYAISNASYGVYDSQ